MLSIERENEVLVQSTFIRISTKEKYSKSINIPENQNLPWNTK